MDMIAPLAKTGVISAATNLWLAIPIGFVFGFALFHSGFTDGRRIAWAFYFKDVGVPLVMFSAIVTGMLGLWGLSLVGFLDISQVYMLPIRNPTTNTTPSSLPVATAPIAVPGQ